ncbi:MAG TPA: hypothetical protein EYN96_05960 [Candidatus Hydrogenedentes bacterium]|nr:hypothetical protein [Candidatus Hydrogenedentota bacterium]
MSPEKGIADSPNTEKTATKKQLCAGIAILALIVLALFGDLILLPGDKIISHQQGDAAQYHVFIRDYGFSEMRDGNLPLWNPLIYSGSPFFATMQPALLYPPSIIYLFLPIAKAINIDIALHLFLFGMFTLLWLNRWKLHWLASTYAAVTLMLCGTTFMRILAGQINVLANMTWFPLLLLAVDGIIDDADRNRFPSPWCILGILSTSLMIYAGYPQSLFICAVCTALYTLMRFIHRGIRWKTLAELTLVAGLPMFISAIQLWTTVAMGFESVRGVDLSYDFGSTYSFPPENLLTMLVPALFGDIIHVWPWGRWGFWDVSMFMGVVGLLLALNAHARDHIALRRTALFMVVVTLFISLGRYAPLHELLFDYVPGFNKFRAPSKFLMVTGFFFAVLSGIGTQNLINHPMRGKWLGVLSLSLGTALLICRMTMFTEYSINPGGRWWNLLKSREDNADAFFWLKLDPEFARETATLAGNSIVIAAVVTIITGTLLLVCPKRPLAAYGVLAVGVIELMAFAYTYRATFDVETQMPDTLSEVAKSMNNDERMLCVSGIPINSTNKQLVYGVGSIWGYDPVVLERYALFMGGLTVGREHADVITSKMLTHGSEPVMLALHLGLFRFTNQGTTYNDTLFRMLRCRAIVKLSNETRWGSFFQFARAESPYGLHEDRFIRDEAEHVHHIENPLPRFFPVNEYIVIDDHDTAFNVIADARFDPGRFVVLESEPVPVPSGSLQNVSIEVLDESTDHVSLRVETSDPVLLVMTDAYAEGWKAFALEGSVQEKYDVLPANVALRAIPLQAGTHHFRIEYLPPVFVYARITTIVSLLLLLLLTIASGWRQRDAVTPAK